MKLSKSKLALAKVINENGGWVGDSAYAANDEAGIICGYQSKPIRSKTTSYYWSGSQRNTWIRGIKTPQWHQTILSREEYYQAYPKADDGISLSELMSRKMKSVKADAEGWIEWKGGGCPVDGDSIVDVEFNAGQIVSGAAKGLSWRHEWEYSNIIKYRLHKQGAKYDTGDGEQNPVVKPEFCESVMRSIPEPETKPTIEKLASEYRNARDYAKRLQKEADEAKVKADEALGKLELAGEAIGLLVSPIREDAKPELNITDWQDLKVGDVVFVESMKAGHEWEGLMSGFECEVVSDGDMYPICFMNENTPVGRSYWIGGAPDGEIKWKFIRRP